jgi:hypothetical protein
MTNITLLSHGRLRLATQCLASLYANTDQDTFNLTVVSDGETDFRVQKLLHSYTTKKNFALLEVTSSGHVLAQLKNLGIFWSRQRFGAGDWLHVGDSDVCFLPGWLEKLTALATTTEPLGFRLWGGQIHPFHQPVSRGAMPDFLAPEITEHDVLDGPSWLMRWATWREIGPLSRKCAPGPCMSEEYQWCARLTRPVIGGSYRDAHRNREGYRIGVISPHVVVHTGLTNSNGQPAPGAEERRKMIPTGVIAE